MQPLETERQSSNSVDEPAQPQRGRAVPRLLIALAAIFAFAAVFFATHHGINLSNDSLKYAQAARSLQDGHGLSTFEVRRGEVDYRPVWWWPPLFPATIASAGSAFGVDPLVACRWLHATFFAALTLLAALMTRYATRFVRVAGQDVAASKAPASLWPAVTAAWLIATAPRLAQVYAAAWSEPLFILLVCLALWGVAVQVVRPRRWLPPAIGVLIGLAYLTRYAGLPLVVGAPALLLVLGSVRIRGWVRRCIDAAICLAIALVPVLLWMLRNRAVGGAMGGRPGGNGRTNADQWDQVRRNLKMSGDQFVDWAVPDPYYGDPDLLRVLIYLGLAAAAVAFALWRARRASIDWPWRSGTAQTAEFEPATKPSGEPTRLLSTLVLAGVGYYGFILLAQSSVAFGKMDYRVLSPLNAIALVAACILVARASHDVRARQRAVLSRGLVSLACAAAACFVIAQNGRYVIGSALDRAEEQVSPTPRPQASPVARWACETLDDGAWVMSNGNSAETLAGCAPLVPASLLRRPPTKAEAAAWRQGIRDTGGAMIVFDGFTRDDELDGDEVAAFLSLQKLPRRPGDDADVYIPIESKPGEYEWRENPAGDQSRSEEAPTSVVSGGT